MYASLECDVEYIRQPLGFATPGPINSNTGTGCKPSHRRCGFRNSHGIDTESVLKKQENMQIPHITVFWGRMFEAAGLPLYLPVSGVSEVGTSKIVMDSNFTHTLALVFEEYGLNRVRIVGSAFAKT